MHYFDAQWPKRTKVAPAVRMEQKEGSITVPGSRGGDLQG
jgi:hypothetical protein